MAIDMTHLRRTTSLAAPRTMIYGPPGFGKTTLASEFPNPVFLQTEDGASHGMEMDTFGILSNFEDVIDALVTLHNEEHDFKTLVVDSIDKLEPLVWAETCARNTWTNIEDAGYGKGYIVNDGTWKEFLALVNAIRAKKNMGVVYINHSTVERFDDPTIASYSRYDIRLHKRAIALFQDDVDNILLVNQDVSIKDEKKGEGVKGVVKALGGGNRWIHTEARPSFVAKNRYNLPPKILYKKGEGFKAMESFLPAFGKTAA